MTRLAAPEAPAAPSKQTPLDHAVVLYGTRRVLARGAIGWIRKKVYGTLRTDKFENVKMIFRVAVLTRLAPPGAPPLPPNGVLLAHMLPSGTRASHIYYKMDLRQVHEALRDHKVPECEHEFSGS